MQISTFMLNQLLQAGGLTVDQVDREYRDDEGRPGLAVRFTDLHDLVVACLGLGSYVPPATLAALDEHLAVYLQDASVMLVAHGVTVGDLGFESALTEADTEPEEADATTEATEATEDAEVQTPTTVDS